MVAANALGAVAGMGLAARSAAAVHVLGSKGASSDREHVPLEVDIGPLQAQGLALSKTERERDDPPRAVSSLSGRDEERLDLVDTERFDLVGIDTRGPRMCCRVAGQGAATDRFVEGRTDRSVDLVSRGWLRRLASLGRAFLDAPVEALQVLGPQRAQLMLAHSRDEVVVDRDAVAGQRATDRSRAGTRCQLAAIATFEVLVADVSADLSLAAGATRIEGAGSRSGHPTARARRRRSSG